MTLLAPFDDRLRSSADFVPHCGNGLIDQSLQLIAWQIGVALLYLGRRLREYFLFYRAFDELCQRRCESRLNLAV